MAKTFASLLRAHRLAAQLSQEALAETARVSLSAIGSYERGVRSSPHRDTVALLAEALGLNSDDRAELAAAARRKPRGDRSSITLEQTYHHLNGTERALFRRLGLFPGPFTIDQAFGAGSAGWLSHDETLAAISSLVAKSLLIKLEDSASVRYCMIDPVRDLALEKAAGKGEAQANTLRYAKWLAEQESRADIIAWTKATLDRLDPEHDLHAAAFLLRALSKAQSGVDLIGTSERAIELFSVVGDHINLARCWKQLAEGLFSTGQVPRARAALNCARALCIENGLDSELELA